MVLYCSQSRFYTAVRAGSMLHAVRAGSILHTVKSVYTACSKSRFYTAVRAGSILHAVRRLYAAIKDNGS